MRISIGLILCAALAACVAPPPSGMEPGLPLAWKDFTGTSRPPEQAGLAIGGCMTEGDRWAQDRAERTMTPAARMSGYAPYMMGAIAEGRRNHILACMRSAGWEPAA
ncbi:hypothetical protein [Roseococcus sp.]|uniref:hypothetical protein n=1 Tax=Roseococcus sp. TaxID=2109646 RepID=UPI003BA92BB6